MELRDIDLTKSLT